MLSFEDDQLIGRKRLEDCELSAHSTIHLDVSNLGTWLHLRIAFPAFAQLPPAYIDMARENILVTVIDPTRLPVERQRTAWMPCGENQSQKSSAAA